MSNTHGHPDPRDYGMRYNGRSWVFNRGCMLNGIECDGENSFVGAGHNLGCTCLRTAKQNYETDRQKWEQRTGMRTEDLG